MRHLAVAIAALASASTAGPSSGPPAGFQHDNDALVFFLSPKALDGLCGASTDAKKVRVACAGKSDDGSAVIALLNPCLVAASDEYAAIACIALAQRNGWRAGKGKPHQPATSPVLPKDNA